MTDIQNGKLTSEQAAGFLGIKPQTMRQRVCTHGSYLGAIPTKTANRYLLWDRKQIEALSRGEKLETTAA